MAAPNSGTPATNRSTRASNRSNSKNTPPDSAGSGGSTRSTRRSKRNSPSSTDEVQQAKTKVQAVVQTSNTTTKSNTKSTSIAASLSKEDGVHMNKLNIDSGADSNKKEAPPDNKSKAVQSNDDNDVVMKDNTSATTTNNTNLKQPPQPPIKQLPTNQQQSKPTIVKLSNGEKIITNDTKTIMKSSNDLSMAANKIVGVSNSMIPKVPIAATTVGAAGVGMGGSSVAANSAQSSLPATKPTQTKSFSLQLAIGPTETKRVLTASKLFNIEINKLQEINEKRKLDYYAMKDNGTADVESGAMAKDKEDDKKEGSRDSSGDVKDEGTKKESPSTTTAVAMEEDKKQPAAAPPPTAQTEVAPKPKKKQPPMIVHSPPAREEPNKPKGSKKKSSEPVIPKAAPSKPPPPVISKPLPSVTSTSNNKEEEEEEEEYDPTIIPPLRTLLLPAAKSAAKQGGSAVNSSHDHPKSTITSNSTTDSGNLLLNSLLNSMENNNISEKEMQSTLVFFLDADKSTKLLAAFDILGVDNMEEESTKAAGKGGRSVAVPKMAGGVSKEEESSSKLVNKEGLISLFTSFLTAISTSVHNINTSLSKDGQVLSNETTKEILEVATFASDNLIDFATKQGSSVQGASFDIFGQWYNSGGFSLVPWLELIDLSKWDYTGIVGESIGSASATTSTTTSAPATAAGTTTTQQTLSNKKARIQQQEPFTPGVGGMNEPIGSPSTLFAQGANILGPTPNRDQSTSRTAAATTTTATTANGGRNVQSFSGMFGAQMDESRTVVSFDFSGSSPTNTNNNLPGNNAINPPSSFHIDITEENLIMLRNLVRRTGFASLTPQHVESLMMKHARKTKHKYGETLYIISRSQFGKFIREIIPKESSKHFDNVEIENFSNYFTNFFTCFDYSWSELNKDEVNAKELMVGFSFLFAGNKSSKLAAAYEMLDVDRVGYLTQRGLMQYLRSYLTMLAGISLLSSNKKTTTQIRKGLMSTKRDDAFLAVENGAKWTLSHFTKAFEQDNMNISTYRGNRNNNVTFEDFAKWYTEGGYTVAPWLELLDLQKFLSLIGNESSTKNYPPDPVDQSLAEVLFTFPLANKRSLVVLRDDAHYVQSVVNELGLLSLTSEDIWSVLYSDLSKSTAEGGLIKPGKKKSIRMEVDQMTFVNCMMRILNGTGKMKHNSSWTDFSPEETLKNFYLSFDLAETKQVPLNQLMGGLTLLCGGKKSSKLMFSFNLFGGDEVCKDEGRRKAALVQNDIFLFFRSFLIVMFSCCNQSLSLTADAVTQYISDTAKSVADDVIAYWKAKKVNKVTFENFSEWYNEGGFETAPWLELLDLNKWVLADQIEQQEPLSQEQKAVPPSAVPPTPATKAAQGRNIAGAEGTGLTPGRETIKALLETPGKAKASPPNFGAGDDHLFDLDMSAVDAEVDEMVSTELIYFH